MVGITFGFGLLCWVRHFPDFVVALSFYWAVNIVAWRYFLRAFIRPAIAASLAKFSAPSEALRAERVRLLENFLCGTWQWQRFGVGALGILILGFLAFTDLPIAIARWATILSPATVQALAITIFVAGTEMWIWARRLSRRVGIRLLEDAHERFSVSVRWPNSSSSRKGHARS